MKKEVWQMAKPVLIKSFFWLVGLPVIGIVAGAIVCLLIGDKNPLWKVGIAIATIGLIWSVVGLWQFVNIISGVFKLSKDQSIAIKVAAALIVAAIGFLIDYFIGGGK